MTIPFIFQQMGLIFNSSPPSSWICTQVIFLMWVMLRPTLVVFVYWALSGFDNGEMGLLILSAHGAMTEHSSLAHMGWPISSQLMQEVVVWGWRSTGSPAQLLWCPTWTALGSGVACLRPIHMLSAQMVQRWRNIRTHSAHPLSLSTKQLSRKKKKGIYFHSSCRTT